MISQSMQEEVRCALVGSFRSFGESGPVYQVLGTTNADSVHILVVESGEELDYPVVQAESDPVAR